MSVTKIESPNDGRSGEESYQQDGTTITTRAKAWRVYTSEGTDDDVTVMAYTGVGKLPLIGTAHPNHPSCKCCRRHCQPESHGQKFQWLFTAQYSTRWDINENPLDDPAKTEWSTETFSAVVWEDVNGGAIVNSAGDPFDPPAEKDDSRWTSITRKNVADSVPDWIFAYQDGVNSDSFTIDGKSIDAGEAKVSAIHLSETQERNEVDYRVLTVTIHYRGEGDDSGSSGYGSGSGADEIEPWDLSILDAGMREIVAGSSGGGLRNITNTGTDGDGEPVTAPAPLDGEGSKIENPTPDNAVFLQFEIYRKRAFSLIEAMFS